MRNCTRRQNGCNRPPNANSECPGVRFCEVRGKWCACVCKEGKQNNAGWFADRAEAIQARDRKAVELFGEYAWLYRAEAPNPPTLPCERAGTTGGTGIRRCWKCAARNCLLRRPRRTIARACDRYASKIPKSARNRPGPRWDMLSWWAPRVARGPPCESWVGIDEEVLPLTWHGASVCRAIGADGKRRGLHREGTGPESSAWYGAEGDRTVRRHYEQVSTCLPEREPPPGSGPRRRAEPRRWPR